METDSHEMQMETHMEGESQKRGAGDGKDVASKKGRFYSRSAEQNNSDKMHEDNLYRHYKPDWATLAETYPETFGKHATKEDGKVTIDWQNPEAVKEVTKTLLKHDFGIEWEMPLDYMCPPVPNRLNYLCWIADLVKILHEVRKPNNREHVNGIDIGTGASCIYPLLGRKAVGASGGADWRFLASEIDREAARIAADNVARNGLGEFIQVVVPTAPGGEDPEGEAGPLRAALGAAGGAAAAAGTAAAAAGGEEGAAALAFDFSMCNPPFFASMEEANKNPRTSCQGRPSEVVCEGGEAAFVGGLIRDSWELGERVGWYTSMVGKKDTLRRLLHALRHGDPTWSAAHGGRPAPAPTAVLTKELLQGYTTRWVLAWSFVPGLGEAQECLSSQKVFGKKKEEGRRSDFSFTAGKSIDPASHELAKSVLSVDDIIQRFQAFVQQANLEGATVALDESQKIRRTEEECITFWVLRKPATTPGVQDAATVRFKITINDKTYKEFEVALHINDKKSSVEDPLHEGRATFWKMTDFLSGEINRSNRKWRRAIKRGKW